MPVKWQQYGAQFWYSCRYFITYVATMDLSGYSLLGNKPINEHSTTPYRWDRDE